MMTCHCHCHLRVGQVNDDMSLTHWCACMPLSCGIYLLLSWWWCVTLWERECMAHTSKGWGWRMSMRGEHKHAGEHVVMTPKSIRVSQEQQQEGVTHRVITCYNLTISSHVTSWLIHGLLTNDNWWLILCWLLYKSVWLPIQYSTNDTYTYQGTGLLTDRVTVPMTSCYEVDCI